MTENIIAAIAACVIAFFTVYITTPPLIKLLTKRNSAVQDMNKKEHVMVVRPGGPSMIAG
ncbi:UDP-N-acetylglucosamine-1-phosphate transferase, partial [Candidatus Bathyarchaeota archaeon]|nr:UDP-N-acetylglucosamine-1-phosphate transferase [Candidatus Bathyarchaeota archaeon]